jgi:tRNA (cmo5U34)-methyltransferase
VKDPSAFDFDGDYGQAYDDLARRVIPGYEHLFEATLALFCTRLDRQAHVLIVGCGTGKEIATFAPAEPQWRFTGVDPSRAMLETAAGVVAQLGAEARVDLHHGYVDDLDEHPRFEAATVINVLHFLADDGAKEHLLRSVAQRVRPGGLVAVFDLHGTPSSPVFRQLMEGWSAFMELRGLTGEAKARFLRRLDAGIDYVPEARLVALCRGAGLSLLSRYFGGFLYGGWLFICEPGKAD